MSDKVPHMFDYFPMLSCRVACLQILSDGFVPLDNSLLVKTLSIKLNIFFQIFLTLLNSEMRITRDSAVDVHLFVFIRNLVKSRHVYNGGDIHRYIFFMTLVKNGYLL